MLTHEFSSVSLQHTAMQKPKKKNKIKLTENCILFEIKKLDFCFKENDNFKMQNSWKNEAKIIIQKETFFIQKKKIYQTRQIERNKKLHLTSTKK